MMDCKEAMTRLQTFLDRELSDEEVIEVRWHLEACPPCQNHFHFEERLKMLVRLKACPETAPASLRERIVREFQK